MHFRQSIILLLIWNSSSKRKISFNNYPLQQLYFSQIIPQVTYWNKNSNEIIFRIDNLHVISEIDKIECPKQRSGMAFAGKTHLKSRFLRCKQTDSNEKFSNEKVCPWTPNVDNGTRCGFESHFSQIFLKSAKREQK